MISDMYGQLVYTEDDLCDLFMKDPSIEIKDMLVAEPINFDPNLELERIPELIEYTLSDRSVEEFDEELTSQWFMPDEYKNLDIAKYLLDKCSCDIELQRVGKELLLFQERGMFDLLKYLKYLVDTMRANNIVWGVGRGSSVSSFVLYLLGVHRINSITYQLDIEEFIR